MDDFLHNLRNPNKKRFERNKPYDGQHRPNDRFSRDRKNLPQQQQRKPPDTDQMPAIKRIMENILDQQRRQTEHSERAAKAAERQAEAMEAIARHFKAQPAEAVPAAPVQSQPAGHVPAPAQSQPAESTVEASAPLDTDDPRQAAGTVILQQRAMGHSFEQIAQSLNAQGIATVSGKGQWRAQNVSRLYNSLAADDSAAPEATETPA
jgi:hypothetical protein